MRSRAKWSGPQIGEETARAAKFARQVWRSTDAPTDSTASLSRGQATGRQWPPLAAWVVEEGAQQGLSVAATKQRQTARLRWKVGVLECSDVSGEASGETSEKDAPWATRLYRGTNHDPQTYVYTK